MVTSTRPAPHIDKPPTQADAVRGATPLACPPWCGPQYRPLARACGPGLAGPVETCRRNPRQVTVKPPVVQAIPQQDLRRGARDRPSDPGRRPGEWPVCRRAPQRVTARRSLRAQRVRARRPGEWRVCRRSTTAGYGPTDRRSGRLANGAFRPRERRCRRRVPPSGRRGGFRGVAPRASTAGEVPPRATDRRSEAPAAQRTGPSGPVSGGAIGEHPHRASRGVPGGRPPGQHGSGTWPERAHCFVEHA